MEGKRKHASARKAKTEAEHALFQDEGLTVGSGKGLKSGRGKLSKTCTLDSAENVEGGLQMSLTRGTPSLFSQAWLVGSPFLTSSRASPLSLWLPREILEDLLSVTSMAARP